MIAGQELVGHPAAVADVSFEVASGGTFVIMGLSGSGKSTLVRCLSRQTQATSGEVWLDEANVIAMDDRALRELRRHKMSMVFQNFGLLPHRTVLDNVGFGLEVRGVNRSAKGK